MSPTPLAKMPVLLLALTLVWLPARASAPPPIPHTISGTVQVDGQNLQNGTPLCAYGGEQSLVCANSVVIPPVGGTSRVAMDVPGDDPETPEDEGAVDGETLRFHIGSPYDVWATQTVTWKAGATTSLRLTGWLTVTPTPGAPLTVHMPLVMKGA